MKNSVFKAINESIGPATRHQDIRELLDSCGLRQADHARAENQSSPDNTESSKMHQARASCKSSCWNAACTHTTRLDPCSVSPHNLQVLSGTLVHLYASMAKEEERNLVSAMFTVSSMNGWYLTSYTCCVRQHYIRLPEFQYPS